MTAEDFVVHLNPVSRDRSNFIINADIAEEGSPRRYEQLWVRQLSDTRFELCCIPFFVFDLALGDEVETEPRDGRQYVLARVVAPSGHSTFRAWFGSTEHAGAREEVVADLQAGGWRFEWYSKNLLAIDAADAGQPLADLLAERERLGHLVYETGRTV